MISTTLKWLPLGPLFLLLAGCAAIPSGPSVMVYPGTGKSFDQFRYSDIMCMQYALEHVGGASPSHYAAQSGIASAVTGTAVGAAAGALIGGNEGAALGAGTGLLVGTMAGSGAAQNSVYFTQQQYDNAYIQCMYANGHLVPMPGHIKMNARHISGAIQSIPPTTETVSPLTPRYTIPPPPPGLPPPPPPGM